MHDHADFGPRLGGHWSIPGGKNKPPRAVIRGGYGFFYKRFESTGLLQAERQNGVTEQAVAVNDPDFYPGTCASTPRPARRRAERADHLPHQSPAARALHADRRLQPRQAPGQVGQISLNYMYSRGEHLFLTRNINAPLPGTYTPGDPASGVRPLGVDQNIYEYESEGASARNRLVVNANVHTKKVGLFGYFMLGKAIATPPGWAAFRPISTTCTRTTGAPRSTFATACFWADSRACPGGFPSTRSSSTSPARHSTSWSGRT